MNKILKFIQKERLYILLLIFIILLNVLLMMPLEVKGKGRIVKEKITVSKINEGLLVNRSEVEKIFYQKKHLYLLFSMTSLLMMAILFLGITMDILLVSSALSGKRLRIATYKIGAVKWNAWDVAKVVILFLFFGYMTIIIESALARTLPFLNNDNFRTVINTTLMDTLAVVFILYFTIGEYKERLISLGISFRNFFKNVFYGITGYIATIPILVLVLIIVFTIANLVKYVPERQPIVDIFLKEKNASFLMYTSLFAAFFGPLIEELFFRGFMYNALKRYIGIFWSALLTASVFAALHTNIVGFFPIMVLGLLLVYLYEKTGTLVSSITVHIIHNFAMVGFVFLMKELHI